MITKKQIHQTLAELAIAAQDAARATDSSEQIDTDELDTALAEMGNLLRVLRVRLREGVQQ